MARAMKDSGIEWIGEIPEGWSLSRLKYAVSEIGSGTTPRDREEFYLNGNIPWIQSGDIYGKDKITDTVRCVTDIAIESNPVLKVYTHDFIVVAMYCVGSAGNVAISKIDACVNQAVCCIKPNEQNSLRFMYYWLIVCRDDFIRCAEGGAQANINRQIIKNQYYVQPTLAEQRRIADYLDGVCGNIDAAVDLTRRTIAEYKKLKQSLITEAVTQGIRGPRPLKPSGIEWIGDIPEEWEVEKGKRLFRETNYRSADGSEELLTVSHITGITPRSQKNVNMFKSETLVDYKICYTGDIAANTMWMWQGAIGVSKYHGVVSPSYNTYRQISGTYDSEYLDYMLRISPMIDAYVMYSTGITASRLRLYPEQFLSLKFIVPPMYEQREIADYLDTRCATIDSLVSAKQQLITELGKYKKSLIYEYVTGKRQTP